MTTSYGPPPPGQVAGPAVQPPAPNGRPRVSGVWRLGVATAVVAALAALALSIVAVTREAAPRPDTASQSVPADSDQAATKTACENWQAAARAMVVARQPFAAATQADDWSWNDPAVQSALAQAQAGTLTQVEYLRAQLTEATPEEVAAPIREYIALNIALIALDGQHQNADMVNGTAKESNAVRQRIESICGKP